MKKTIFTIATIIGLQTMAIGQTIYSISSGGEHIINALDRMVNEHTLPPTGTNSNYNNTTSNPINVTAAVTGGNDVTAVVAYSDIPKETWANLPNATGACSTQLAMLTDMTITFGRYRAQGSTPAWEFARLIWSEDPASVPGSCNSTPHSCGPYYIYLAQSQYLNPMHAVGHHNYPSVQACGVSFRNHIYKLWLLDGGGQNIHFGDVKDILSYELETNSNSLPTSCTSIPALNSSLLKIATPSTGFSDINIPNGIKLEVLLFNGNTKEVYLFTNYTSLLWKNAYNPCTPNDDLDCKYISTLFNPMNPEEFILEGPSKVMLNNISINPIRYDWTTPSLSISTRANHTQYSSTAVGMMPVGLEMRYVKYSDLCYHTASVYNSIYFPGVTCSMPPPPVQNPKENPTSDESGLIATTDVESRIKLFPNPTNDLFTIQGLSKSKARISLVDMSGKVLYEYSGKMSKDHQIDVSKLETGFYIIHITQNGETYSKKLIVK
jgi:hypothetical protein